VQALHVDESLAIVGIRAQKVRFRSIESIAKNQGFSFVVCESAIKGLDFG